MVLAEAVIELTLVTAVGMLNVTAPVEAEAVICPDVPAIDETIPVVVARVPLVGRVTEVLPVVTRVVV